MALGCSDPASGQTRACLRPGTRSRHDRGVRPGLPVGSGVRQRRRAPQAGVGNPSQRRCWRAGSRPARQAGVRRMRRPRVGNQVIFPPVPGRSRRGVSRVRSTPFARARGSGNVRRMRRPDDRNPGNPVHVSPRGRGQRQHDLQVPGLRRRGGAGLLDAAENDAAARPALDRQAARTFLRECQVASGQRVSCRKWIDGAPPRCPFPAREA
jgi:hypothetical protein